MDETFSFFLSKFGPPRERREASRETQVRYRGRVPERLQEYWSEHGLCGYRDGLLWTVDPAEYQSLIDDLLEGTPLSEDDEYSVIMRTAFGDLIAWGKETGTLRMSTALGIVWPNYRPPRPRIEPAKRDTHLESFFAVTAANDAHACDFFDEAEKPLFERALKKLGPVDADQVYGFFPALALGGPATLANLQKVGLMEHLEILAQLERPPQIIAFPLPRT